MHSHWTTYYHSLYNSRIVFLYFSDKKQKKENVRYNYKIYNSWGLMFTISSYSKLFTFRQSFVTSLFIVNIDTRCALQIARNYRAFLSPLSACCETESTPIPPPTSSLWLTTRGPSDSIDQCHVTENGISSHVAEEERACCNVRRCLGRISSLREAHELWDQHEVDLHNK